ncbi:porin family protein [Pedobacter deserti]|uniref:porin family protein n=1 Tax=Pedobacter deserti TaxID=2817382 RepID=UPI00210CFF45|nr:porin family protein [Pedobacter sp. SYSU D00382]
MKKILLVALLTGFNLAAFSQLMPSFQLGLKAGANLSKLSTENTFSSDNRAGYFAGLWARVGAAGIHLQPELYLSGKNTTLTNSAGQENKVKFTSMDVPILVGTKLGAAGVGLRFNTGPVISFILDDEQSFGDAASSAFSGDFKGQNIAWQLGAGLDIGSLGVDLRYEAGLSKLGEDQYEGQKLRLFTFGLAYKLF